MDRYIYLSMVPESLVVSMLPPEEFGRYLATGTAKRPHGQAIFFCLKPDFTSDRFDFSDLDKRCVPHDDGTPKHSVYLGIYRVLESVPLDAVQSVWLTTLHGRSLELPPGEIPSKFPGMYHLYQEICPVHPLIASSLAPDEFCRFITDPSRPISVPRICFADLRLEGLSYDLAAENVANLPYEGLEHIRDCLTELLPGGKKVTKTVDRLAQQSILYRCINSGFFLGDQDGILYYPYPTAEEMEKEHYAWWRCANDAELVHT